MIAIINEAGLDLHLNENQNLVTEQAVAWLTDDELPAEISYPIDAPLDDHNKRFVGYGYRVDAALPTQIIPVTVQMDGVLYRRCLFAFKVQNGKLNGYLKIDSAEVYDKLRKLTLLEALPDVIRLGTGIIDGGPKVLANRMAEIAEMPPGEFPLTFFPLRNELFFEESLDKEKLPGFTRTGYVNFWGLHPIGGYGFRQDGGFINGELGYPVVPFFYLSWVLRRIMAQAGYQIESTWLASEEAQRIVVENQTAIKTTIGTLLTDPVGYVQGHQVTAGMHLPDMSVSDFLKAVKGRFGLVFGFNANSRTCYMERFVDVVKAGAAIDLSAFQVGDYDSNPSEQSGYSVEDFIDESDELNKDPKGNTVPGRKFVVGSGVQSISLKAGTSDMTYTLSTLMPVAADGQPPLAVSYWLVPTLRQPGNIIDPNYRVSERALDVEGKRRNNIGLKLLSYRGMTQDSRGNPYPLASNSVRDGRQVVVGTQGLTLPGRLGAWQQVLWAYYYFRDNTQKLSIPLRMPVAVLSSLKLHQAISLSLEDEILRTYLVNKIQADAPGRDGKVMVRLEVLTLPTGIDQPATVADPEFYVELLVEDFPIVNLNVYYSQFIGLTTYTLRYWQDAGKTTPAELVDRSVNLRRIRKGIPNAGNAGIRVDFHEESSIVYPASGAGETLQPAKVSAALYSIGESVIRYLLPDVIESNPPLDAYTLTYQLDPGDDYTILTS